MTRILSEDGRQYAVTVLKVEQHEVLSHKTIEKHGYEAVVVGTVEAKEGKLKKPMQGYFKALGDRFYKKIKEFRGVPSDKFAVGNIYGADVFVAGQTVDVTGISIGKGFAGAMKRHNFRGLRASHGVSVSHRSHGSTGNREEPGKVFKGKKMAGHLGAEQVTILNLKVHAIDGDLLIIRGGIPGPEGGYILVKDAVKGKIRT